MDQIRQILKQLTLHLELNIAMCDMIDDHEKRMKTVETNQAALKTRLDALSKQLSELNYMLSSKRYEERRSALKD